MNKSNTIVTESFVATSEKPWDELTISEKRKRNAECTRKEKEKQIDTLAEYVKTVTAKGISVLHISSEFVVPETVDVHYTSPYYGSIEELHPGVSVLAYNVTRKDILVMFNDGSYCVCKFFNGKWTGGLQLRVSLPNRTYGKVMAELGYPIDNVFVQTL
jgi:hypothetical protein